MKTNPEEEMIQLIIYSILFATLHTFIDKNTKGY